MQPHHASGALSRCRSLCLTDSLRSGSEPEAQGCNIGIFHFDASLVGLLAVTPVVRRTLTGDRSPDSFKLRCEFDMSAVVPGASAPSPSPAEPPVPLWSAKLMYLALFSALSAYSPFLTVYLEHTGLSPSQIGMCRMLLPLAGLSVQVGTLPRVVG